MHEGTEKRRKMIIIFNEKKMLDLLEIFADCSLIMTQQEEYVRIERICLGRLHSIVPCNSTVDKM